MNCQIPTSVQLFKVTFTPHAGDFAPRYVKRANSYEEARSLAEQVKAQNPMASNIKIVRTR